MRNVKVYIKELIDEGIIAREVADQLMFLIKNDRYDKKKRNNRI